MLQDGSYRYHRQWFICSTGKGNLFLMAETEFTLSSGNEWRSTTLFRLNNIYLQTFLPVKTFFQSNIDTGMVGIGYPIQYHCYLS